MKIKDLLIKNGIMLTQILKSTEDVMIDYDPDDSGEEEFILRTGNTNLEHFDLKEFKRFISELQGLVETVESEIKPKDIC